MRALGNSFKIQNRFHALVCGKHGNTIAYGYERATAAKHIGETKARKHCHNFRNDTNTNEHDRAVKTLAVNQPIERAQVYQAESPVSCISLRTHALPEHPSPSTKLEPPQALLAMLNKFLSLVLRLSQWHCTREFLVPIEEWLRPI